MTIEFTVVAGSLVVSGHADSGGPVDEGRLRVSRQILDVITDEYSVHTDDGVVRFRIVCGLNARRDS
jgi:hypothetical protein